MITRECKPLYSGPTNGDGVVARTPVCNRKVTFAGGRRLTGNGVSKEGMYTCNVTRLPARVE